MCEADTQGAHETDLCSRDYCIPYIHSLLPLLWDYYCNDKKIVSQRQSPRNRWKQGKNIMLEGR